KVNSGVIEISPDTLAVVRVEDFQPAHVPPLEQVRGRVESRLVSERALEAAAAAGEKAMAVLRDGGAQAELPESFGTPLTITRLESQGVPDVVLDAIYELEAESTPAYTGVLGPQGYVVARLESVEPGDTEAPLVAGLTAELA